jgi:flagellar motor switch protein FliG
MSFCPLMSNAENKVECSNDCTLYWKDHGCLFRLQIKQLESLRKTNGSMPQKQETEPQARPFEFIESCDPADVLDVLQREQPQTIAHVLSYLAPPKASVLLQFLPPGLQGEVAHRIATMDRVSLEIIRGIERSIQKKLSASDPCGVEGGIDFILEILGLTDKDVAKQIMRFLEDNDPELAEELKNRLPDPASGKVLSDNEITQMLSSLDVESKQGGEENEQ